MITKSDSTDCASQRYGPVNDLQTRSRQNLPSHLHYNIWHGWTHAWKM